MVLDDTQTVTASLWWANGSPKTKSTKSSTDDTHSSSRRWISPSDYVSPSCNSQSACWRSWAACCSSRPHFSTRMLRCSCSTTHCCRDQRPAVSDESHRSVATLYRQTLCRSPLYRAVFRRVHQIDIGASSHTISFVWRISSAVVLRGVILHVEFASTGIGSLNHKCADDTTRLTTELTHAATRTKWLTAPALACNSVQLLPLWGWDPAALLLITVI